MKQRISRIVIFFLLCQIAIFLLSFFLYHEINLLNYINLSFYLGGIFILLSIFFFTVERGFFDIITKSFRRVFAGKHVTKKQIEEMTPLSQVITFDYSLLFINGVLITVIMFIALYFYF